MQKPFTEENVASMLGMFNRFKADKLELNLDQMIVYGRIDVEDKIDIMACVVTAMEGNPGMGAQHVFWLDTHVRDMFIEAAWADGVLK